MPLTSCGHFLFYLLRAIIKSQPVPSSLGFALLLSLTCLAPSTQSQSSVPQPPPAPTDHEQFFPYWTTEAGWDTDLVGDTILGREPISTNCGWHGISSCGGHSSTT